MTYILKVQRTKTGWKISSNRSLKGWSGAESEGKKFETIKRARRLATNLSKKLGVNVKVQAFTAAGKLQNTESW